MLAGAKRVGECHEQTMRVAPQWSDLPALTPGTHGVGRHHLAS